MRCEPEFIFLVEDNPWDVWLIEETLRRSGVDFRLEHSDTVENAIQSLKRYALPGGRTPSLILLDYNLPLGNGCDVLRAIRDFPKLNDTPRAMITTFLAPPERELAISLGASCCIAKPSSLHRFFTDVGAQLTELLGSSRPAASRAPMPG